MQVSAQGQTLDGRCCFTPNCLYIHLALNDNIIHWDIAEINKLLLSKQKNSHMPIQQPSHHENSKEAGICFAQIRTTKTSEVRHCIYFYASKCPTLKNIWVPSSSSGPQRKVAFFSTGSLMYLCRFWWRWVHGHPKPELRYVQYWPLLASLQKLSQRTRGQIIVTVQRAWP